MQGKTERVTLVPNTTVDAGEIKYKADRDHDGMPDEDETKNGTNPDDPADADADKDGDGVSNGDEVAAGMNPAAGDSDGDGALDGEELQLGFDPNDSNSKPSSGASLNGIRVTPDSFSISINTMLGQQTTRLKVTGLFSDGSTSDLTRVPGTTYSSLNESVAIVDDFGSVAGVSAGTTSITVQSGGFSAVASVSVSTFTPAPLSSITIPGYANAVDVSGDYAFVAAGAAGLQVLNVSDRSAPRIVASLATAGNANDVKVVGGRAYVAGGSAGLHIIDVSTPSSPALLGTADTPGEAEDVAVSGARAYVADGVAGLQVVDVSGPSSPSVIGAVDTPGYARGVDVSGQLVAVADGVTPTPNDGGGGPPVDLTDGGGAVDFASFSMSSDPQPTDALRIVDVSDPASPQELGDATLPGEAMDVVVRDRLAYVAALDGGVAVVNFGSPASPSVVNNATGFMPRCMALFGRYVMAAEVRFFNSVPVYDVSDPGVLGFRGALDFTSLGDYEGTGVSLDERYVYLTGSQSGLSPASGTSGQTRLLIGQYRERADQITDTAGVAPTVTISSPRAGQSVSEGRAVTVSAAADDDVGVAAVSFTVNGAVVATDVAAPFEFTARVPLGTVSLTLGAKAVDYGGNTGEAPPVTLSVTPNRAPTISLNEPVQGAQWVEGQEVPISAEAADEDGSVARVEYRVNGEIIATLTEAPYATRYQVPLGAGSLTVEATAVDDLGKSVTAARPVQVLADTEAPVITFRAPAEGSQLYNGQAVTFVADAADNARVERVTFAVNGEPYAEFFSAPYETSYVVPSQDVTELTVVVTATDPAGHSASVSRTFSVVADPGTTVTGRILDGPERRPVAGAHVSILDGQFSTLSGADGAFSFQNVPTVYGGISASATHEDFFLLQANTLPVEPVRGGVTDLGDVWFHAQYATTLPEVPTAFSSVGYTFFGFANPHDSIYAPDGVGRLVPSLNPRLTTGGVVAADQDFERLYIQRAGRPGLISVISFDGEGRPVEDDSFASGLPGEAREVASFRGGSLGRRMLAFLGDDGAGGTALRVRLGDSQGSYAAPVELPVEPGTTLRSLKLADVKGDGDVSVLAVKLVSPTDARLVVYTPGAGGGFSAPVESPVTVRPGAFARDFVLGSFTDSFNLDLAVLGPDRVRLYRGDGAGGFSPDAELPLPEGMTPTGISEGVIFRNGGAREFIVTASEAAAPTRKAVLIYEQDESGLFAPPRAIPYSAPAHSGAVRAGAAHLNQNVSFPDLIVVDGDMVLSIMDAFRLTLGG